MIKRFPEKDPVVLQSGLDSAIAPFNTTFKEYNVTGLTYVDLPINPAKGYQINLRHIAPNRSANRATSVLLYDKDQASVSAAWYAEYGGGSGSAVSAYQQPYLSFSGSLPIAQATTLAADICYARFDIKPTGFTLQRSYYYSGKHYGYRSYGYWGPGYQNIDVMRVYGAGFAFVSGYADIMEVPW